LPLPSPSASADPEAPLAPVLAEEARRRRRKLSWMFALSLVAFYPMDLLLVGHPVPATLVLRAFWGLEVLLHMECQRWLGGRGETALTCVHAVFITAFFMGLILLTGGLYSPYLSTSGSLPLIVALVFTESTLPPLFAGFTCILGLVGMGWAEGRLSQMGGWSMVVATAAFFGCASTLRFRKAQAAVAQMHIERTRREALEKLAVAERQRAQAEKLAAVGRLAAGVMHEINNPLAFVRSNLHYLRTEVLAQPLPGPVRGELGEVFDETHVGVERIQRIVTDLKGFARADAEELEACVLADVVSDAARLAGMRLRHVARLTVELPPELPRVLVAPRRLSQVVLNLLVNAGDALEEAKVEHGEVRVRAGLEDGCVFLVVEDNGPGFPPSVQARLFEAFFTTKGPDKGTGLGLSLSREMVERFGGTLRADNRPEGGACVRVELPVLAQNPPVEVGQGLGEVDE
jgi:signal transduction histidine kinase